MITHPEEVFIMPYKEIDDKSLNSQIIKANNGIVLVSKCNHNMDKIIDMKQN